MTSYQLFSPASPTPSENEGMTLLELELERKENKLQTLQNGKYMKALQDLKDADRALQLVESKEKSMRNGKRKRVCDGCRRKYCQICNLEKAAKKVRFIETDIDMSKAELNVIRREIQFEREQRRHSNDQSDATPAAGNSITVNDEAEAVKEEADVKTEPEDDYIMPTIGMVNAVKSEPIEPNDGSAGSDGSDSSAGSFGSDGSDGTAGSDTDERAENTTSEDESYTDPDEETDYNNDSSIQTDEELQDQYPDTPEQSQDEFSTTDDNNSESDIDEDADSITRFKKILSKL